MSFLRKIVRGAIDFFISPIYSAFNLLTDAAQSLLLPSIPEPPAGIKNGGKAYNADLRQNQAALGDVKAVGYGRWRDWYSYCSLPYVEYLQDQEILHAYLHVTRGLAEIQELFIGDVPFATFAGAQYEVLAPGETLTLGHPKVYTSEDVGSSEIPGGIVGPVQLRKTLRYAPTDDHPASAPDRIVLIGSQALNDIPLGVVTVSGTASNDGVRTVTGKGAGIKGFSLYSWLVITEPLVTETVKSTLEYTQTISGAKTIQSEHIGLVFDDVRSKLVPDDDTELTEFRVGDDLQVFDSASNDGTTFRVIAVDSDGLVVTPAPVYEHAADVTVRLESRRVGPVYACPPGEQCERLGIDIFFEGLGKADDDGSVDSLTVTFEARYRPVDDAGNPLGAWVAESLSCSGAEFKPKRFSFAIDLDTPIRPQVDLRRITIQKDDSQRRDNAVWGGLRGYMVAKPGQTLGQDEDCTRIAVQIRATGQLSRVQSKSINGFAQRLLPVWDGAAWSTPQATRNPAWAAVDWIKTESLGLLTDADLDLDGFLAFANGCETRGDTFDAAFDREVIFWEGLQSILRVGRGRAYRDPASRLISVYRDEATAPVLLLADGINCQLGALALATPTQDTPTGVRVKFTDPVTWQERADGPLAGAGDDPREVSFFGCTNWERAWAEAYYEYQDLRYRVQKCSAETEMEGLLAALGKRVLVGSAVKGWGQVAEVADADGLELTLQPPPFWTEGAQHYVRLQGPTGLPGARIDCSYVSVGKVLLASAPDVTLRINEDWRTIVLIGHDAVGSVPAEHPRLACVESMAPSGLRQASVQLRLDDERVYADPGPAPADVYALSGAAPDLAVSGFEAQAIDALMIEASWDAVSGAIAYEIEQELDPIGWQRQFVGAGTSARWQIKPGSVGDQVRIRAYGDAVIGPWTTIFMLYPGDEGRVTEDGAVRITQSGELRILG